MPSFSRTLLVDLDGTLLRLKGSKRFFYVRLISSLVWRALSLVRLREVPRVLRTLREAIYSNQSSDCIEANLYRALRERHGIPPAKTEALLKGWVEKDFARFEQLFEPIEGALEVLDRFAASGYRLVLATNPVVSLQSIRMRVMWAGLDPGRFSLITHCGNMRRCKPDPDYYREILATLGVDANNCLMIGNDPVADAAAEKAGIRTLILDFKSAETGWTSVEALA